LAFRFFSKKKVNSFSDDDLVAFSTSG